MANAKPIPDGYHSVQPYLILKKAAQAIAFYTRAFGARERFRMENNGRIGHAEIEIGDSCVMLRMNTRRSGRTAWSTTAARP